jgi:hypothetical protein
MPPNSTLPISPFTRGVAGVLGGLLIVVAMVIIAAVLPPLVTRHPPSLFAAFGYFGMCIAAVQTGRVLLRAAVTGVSPSWRTLKS